MNQYYKTINCAKYIRDDLSFKNNNIIILFIKLSSQLLLGSSQVTHNMHMRESLNYLCTQNKQAFRVGPWQQDVMAKRTLWGVWKVNGRKSHTAESGH